MQCRRIHLVRDDNVTVLRAARELLCLRLERLIEAMIRNDTEVQAVAMPSDRIIDRGHQRLPVRATIKCAEEDRHAILWHVIRTPLGQSFQLILKEIDIRIEFTQEVREVLRRSLHGGDGAEGEVVILQHLL